ncbi:preprotein translocase subunit TatB [uncultured Oxalicibacterium sp.]|uniref:preprotein translocase subunit TatB n=1 Tax=uncultured Oxalicibacterium sp. TaxID=1168540 RepID=UPI0025F1472C|nr:preprotein translocase subunit TatB [uncultured Oxalicibacterium sp.]
MKISFLRICAVWRRFRRGALRRQADHAQYVPQIESLVRRADPAASWHARANWMIDLADWLRHEPKVSLLGRDEWRRLKHYRLRFLLDWLDAHRDARQAVQATLRKTLREATGHELFSSTGMPRESAFFSELSERLLKLFLPKPLGQHDLSTLFTLMFPDVSDAEWLLELDDRTMARLWKLCGDEGIAHGYRQQIDEAMLYLVQMVVAVGISPAFRQRLEPRMQLLATPFMSLRRELEHYLITNTRDQAALRSVRMLLAVCQAQTDRIYAHLDEFGMSVGLVYHLERMRAQLHRIGRLLELRNAPYSESGSGQIQAVLVDLITAHHHRSSVRDLIRRSFSLLARKIVERTAYHGELYIANDRREYGRMLKAAMLGGLVLAFTGLLKFGIDRARFAEFFEGFFLSLNFAVGFLLVSAIGGVLAARQPVITASAMAAKMGALDTIEGLRSLLTQIAALLRSQAAAVFGNVFTVTLMIVGMGAAMLLMMERPLINPGSAHAALHSLSVVGLTPLFAAFTGLLLWLASLFSGYADNWFALRRLKVSLANHRRLVHAMGAARAERFAAWLERNVASIVGNLSLAILLGMVPAIAHFFGLPVEIRHVALSAATLAVATISLGWPVLLTTEFWLAFGGLVAIGLLNVGVAFTCALMLALRARDVSRRVRRVVYRSVLRRITLSPLTFFLPIGLHRRTIAEVKAGDSQDVASDSDADEPPSRG